MTVHHVSYLHGCPNVHGHGTSTPSFNGHGLCQNKLSDAAEESTAAGVNLASELIHPVPATFTSPALHHASMLPGVNVASVSIHPVPATFTSPILHQAATLPGNSLTSPGCKLGPCPLSPPHP